MSAAAAAPDRLSDLSDDLLTHILSFAPIREAASTTALSRRWRRPLWLDTAAVNLDYRSYTTTAGGAILWRAMADADHGFACHHSHGCGPKKLTVLMRDDATTHESGILCAPRCVTEDNEEEEEEAAGFEGEEYAAEEGEEEEDNVGVQTEEEEEEAEDSGSGIQELRVEWLNNGCPCTMLRHALYPCSLPFATLRVLDLTGCSLRPHSERRRVPFPCLEALRLRRCRALLTTLQDMISAAPRLADVRLEAVQFLDGHAVYRLRCPTATAVVMDNCGMLVCNCNLYHGGCSVKLSAPRFRRFRYTQAASFNGTSFSLESPTTLTLDHVHLALPAASARLRHSLLSSVRRTSLLRLTAFSLADLNHGYNSPMLFTRLERLEIQELSGWCVLDHAAAATGVVDLLSSCPCLRELRLKFRWRECIREANSDPADEMAAVADFSPCRSIDDDDLADCCDNLEDDLQGRLSRRCRLDCLRRVVVQFDADELTCFQVELLKFLAKNARTLEEVVVDGGKGYDSSRIDEKLARWRRKRRPTPLSPPPPPPLSEFPPLEEPLYLEGEVDAGNPCLDGEVADGNDTRKLDLEVPLCSYGVNMTTVTLFIKRDERLFRGVIYDDDYNDSEDDEVEDIIPRHFIHSARKKKGGSPECWSVKPKYKGLITAEWRSGGVGGRRLRRRRPSRGGGGDVTAGTSLPPVPLPATPAPGLPPSLCVFRSLRRAPPPAPWRSLFERRGTPRAPPSRVPLITELLCG